MHTRTVALCLSLLACATVSGFLLVGSLTSDREEAQIALEETIDRASDTYRSRTNAGALRSFQEKILKEMSIQAETIAKEKRMARLALANARKQIDAMQTTQTTFVERNRQRSAQGVSDADNRMEQLLRELFVFSPMNVDREPLAAAAKGIAQTGEPDESALMLRTYATTHESLIGGITSRTLDAFRIAEEAKKAKMAAVPLEQKLEELRTEYRDVIARADRAQTGLLISDKQLAAAKSMAAEVHRSVLKLQSNLAQIDAQLRHESVDSLVEMGLLSGAPEEAPEQKAAAPNFIWPVQGPLAAHFHDPLYRQFFGIPHQGIDIMVPQLTPVKSAEDGVVFLVKDGGETGYSYILIGHRDGVATLYGHLNVLQVAPGQEIRRGETIGLSGGAPGSYGAGQVTTGPHLHFEVIFNGANVDPLSYLP